MCAAQLPASLTRCALCGATDSFSCAAGRAICGWQAYASVTGSRGTIKYFYVLPAEVTYLQLLAGTQLSQATDSGVCACRQLPPAITISLPSSTSEPAGLELHLQEGDHTEELCEGDGEKTGEKLTIFRR